MQETYFERAGGEAKLRPLVDAFVRRVVDDLMIGFLFRRTLVQRLIELEYAFAAHSLGAKIPYVGRPMAQAHRHLRIAGGQFARRRQILVETQHDFGLPADVQKAWLAHVDALREEITQDSSGACHGRKVTAR